MSSTFAVCIYTHSKLTRKGNTAEDGLGDGDGDGDSDTVKGRRILKECRRTQTLCCLGPVITTANPGSWQQQRSPPGGVTE